MNLDDSDSDIQNITIGPKDTAEILLSNLSDVGATVVTACSEVASATSPDTLRSAFSSLSTSLGILLTTPCQLLHSPALGYTYPPSALPALTPALTALATATADILTHTASGPVLAPIVQAVTGHQTCALALRLPPPAPGRRVLLHAGLDAYLHGMTRLASSVTEPSVLGRLITRDLCVLGGWGVVSVPPRDARSVVTLMESYVSVAARLSGYETPPRIVKFVNELRGCLLGNIPQRRNELLGAGVLADLVAALARPQPRPLPPAPATLARTITLANSDPLLTFLTTASANINDHNIIVQFNNTSRVPAPAAPSPAPAPAPGTTTSSGGKDLRGIWAPLVSAGIVEHVEHCVESALRESQSGLHCETIGEMMFTHLSTTCPPSPLSGRTLAYNTLCTLRSILSSAPCPPLQAHEISATRDLIVTLHRALRGAGTAVQPEPAPAPVPPFKLDALRQVLRRDAELAEVLPAASAASAGAGAGAARAVPVALSADQGMWRGLWGGGEGVNTLLPFAFAAPGEVARSAGIQAAASCQLDTRASIINFITSHKHKQDDSLPSPPSPTPAPTAALALVADLDGTFTVQPAAHFTVWTPAAAAGEGAGAGAGADAGAAVLSACGGLHITPTVGTADLSLPSRPLSSMPPLTRALLPFASALQHGGLAKVTQKAAEAALAATATARTAGTDTTPILAIFTSTVLSRAGLAWPGGHAVRTEVLARCTPPVAARLVRAWGTGGAGGEAGKQFTAPVLAQWAFELRCRSGSQSPIDLLITVLQKLGTAALVEGLLAYAGAVNGDLTPVECDRLFWIGLGATVTETPCTRLLSYTSPLLRLASAALSTPSKSWLATVPATFVPLAATFAALNIQSTAFTIKLHHLVAVAAAGGLLGQGWGWAERAVRAWHAGDDLCDVDLRVPGAWPKDHITADSQFVPKVGSLAQERLPPAMLAGKFNDPSLTKTLPTPASLLITICATIISRSQPDLPLPLPEHHTEGGARFPATLLPALPPPPALPDLPPLPPAPASLGSVAASACVASLVALLEHTHKQDASFVLLVAAGCAVKHLDASTFAVKGRRAHSNIQSGFALDTVDETNRALFAGAAVRAAAALTTNNNANKTTFNTNVDDDDDDADVAQPVHTEFTTFTTYCASTLPLALTHRWLSRRHAPDAPTLLGAPPALSADLVAALAAGSSLLAASPLPALALQVATPLILAHVTGARDSYHVINNDNDDYEGEGEGGDGLRGEAGAREVSNYCKMHLGMGWDTIVAQLVSAARAGGAHGYATAAAAQVAAMLVVAAGQHSQKGMQLFNEMTEAVLEHEHDYLGDAASTTLLYGAAVWGLDLPPPVLPSVVALLTPIYGAIVSGASAVLGPQPEPTPEAPVLPLEQRIALFRDSALKPNTRKTWFALYRKKQHLAQTAQPFTVFSGCELLIPWRSPKGVASTLISTIRAQPEAWRAVAGLLRARKSDLPAELNDILQGLGAQWAVDDQ